LNINVSGGNVKIPELKGDKVRLGWLGSLRIGKNYFSDNGLKGFLKYAKETDVDAILSTGDIVHVDIARHTSRKNQRARTDLDMIEETEYPDTVRDVLGPEERYANAEEQLDSLFKEVYSVFSDNETPIYLVFGAEETELSSAISNDRLRGQTFEDQAALKSAIRAKQRDLRRLEKQYARLKDPNKKRSYTWKMKAIEGDIDELDYYLRNKVIMTNQRVKERNKFNQEADDYVKRTLENAIPHSKVISTGNGYIKVNDELVEFMYNMNKRSHSPSNKTFRNMINKSRVELTDGKTLPKIRAQGGLHPKYGSVSLRTDMGSLSMKNPSYWQPHSYSYLKQVPPLFDRDMAEEVLQDEALIVDDNVKMQHMMNPFSGAVVTEMDTVMKDEVLSEPYLCRLNEGKADIKPEMFYGLVTGDEHIGDNFMSMPRQGSKSSHKRTIELFYENLDDIIKDTVGEPVVYWDNQGDIIQGKHFQTEIEINPEYLPPMALQRKLEKMRAKGVPRDELERFVIRNSKLAPLTTIEQQKEELNQIIQPEFYRKIVYNARNNDMMGPAVVFIGGNHDLKTTRPIGYFVTTEIADGVRAKTGASAKEVIAPMLGASSLGNFFRGKRGHKRYNFYEKHKQTTTHQEDLTVGIIKANENRAEHHDVVLGGHAHMDDQAIADDTIYIISKTWQDRNAFGEEMNFRLPTVGAKVLGLPVDGIEYGPVKFIEISSDYIHKYG